MTSESLSIGLAVPAYRNVPRLSACLESIRKQAPTLLERAVVVDDSGTGEVAQALQGKYPAVKWITHNGNQGFGVSASEAVRECPADIVCLLNDDVRIKADPIPSLQGTFSDLHCFAATFQSFDESGGFREGAKRLIWSFGFPRILHNPRDQLPPVGDMQRSSYAVGGHCAYRREMFVQLDGFDPLYDPFYWEDVDLAHRALQHGWHTVYLPECHVVHETSGAIRSSRGEDQIRALTLRNRLLFAYRHCPPRQRWKLSLSLKLQLLRARMSGDQDFISAKLEADQRFKKYISKSGTPHRSCL